VDNYQPSDYSDFDDDPFFGANLDDAELGVPLFLRDDTGWDPAILSAKNPINAPVHNVASGSSYPLTPEHTASIHTTSPRSDARATNVHQTPARLPTSISPQELQRPFVPIHPVGTAQWTPSQSSSSRSSEDGGAPPSATTMQSPRVTVSVWDKDEHGRPIQTVERALEDAHSASYGGIQSAGDLIFSQSELYSPRRDSLGRWHRDHTTGQAGLAPDQRPSNEVPSLKEESHRREVEGRNNDVDKWLAEKVEGLSIPQEDGDTTIKSIDRPGRDSSDDIPLGDQTENRHVPGQTYFTGTGGQMTDADLEIIASDRNWADAPVVHPIRTAEQPRHQPQTSADAIRKFEQACRDTDSILSRSATWGTRRRSFTSAVDYETGAETSGRIVLKLPFNLGNGDRGNKPGGVFGGLRGLVRKSSSSSLLKRSRGSSGEGSPQDEAFPLGKRDSTPHLAPSSRTSSWGKKPTPSINTALVSMGHGFASIGTTHTRKGSVSSGNPITSPKSAKEGLIVKNALRRPRSKSDLPRSGGATEMASHPNLTGMWKKSGGPPVATLGSKTYVPPVSDDEDDDDDDFYVDNDMKKEANLIDTVTANFSGFREHVQMLNPSLESTHGYLVDRIAHQQIIRYKHLLNLKVKHLGLGANCPCGPLCIALGGTANILDQKRDAKGMDPLSGHFLDDEDATPIEGAISQENFPQDIPVPPTQYLPAEFECQLCYSKKKFQKPSDWTKHVHEDVQPFTCTWDKCREPKIFKRKADWVRHENEGHRHLEWWTCDVDDCRHVCYRRDNFLQHLVREHKFQEPKHKTKAQVKRAGGMDPTWQKVEQCHVETNKRPQDEPCRFCGKAFPTWKKLTVHLAKHMEQISLPVLRLVAAKAKELAADTIISPVQDLPPRHLSLPFDVSPSMDQQFAGNPPAMVFGHPTQQQQQMNYGQAMDPTSSFMYPMSQQMGQPPYQPPYFSAPFSNVGQQHVQQSPLVGPQHVQQSPLGQMHHGFGDMPTTSAPYGGTANTYMPISGGGNTEAFTQVNALGLQNINTMSMGGQVSYDGVMSSGSVNGSPFSAQGSASPYAGSPHQGMVWGSTGKRR
jgi:hypothetical protein